MLRTSVPKLLLQRRAHIGAFLAPHRYCHLNSHFTMTTAKLIYSVVLLLMQDFTVRCHIPGYASTPSNKVEQFCVQAESCVHDTIQICGTMGDEKRTFLDLCDLLEYACDTNQIYTHVEDVEGCPEPRKKI